MPICTLHLLSLSCPVSQFIDQLVQDSALRPIVVANVHRWVITPSISSELLRKEWHIVLLLPGQVGLVETEVAELLAAEWKVEVGVPSRLLSDFGKRNQELLHPVPGSIPPLTGALEKRHGQAPDSAQDLELSDELLHWIEKFQKSGGAQAVTMLNLLAFNEGMKSEYIKYGKAFAKSVGSRRGGSAKLVGNVISPSSQQSSDGYVTDREKLWDEFAMAHYPSIAHFADMIASEDYQEVNHKHRLPSLKDTMILCTTDLQLPSDPHTSAKL
ncbi:hypothetical protein OE88DRAFT_1652989 [Heliocybe sulcata]|uniref:Uncharacterized protein n=1 Tax=Heliocybe sulcata TaxID=5364 RepID=A0A5C3NBC3_9AGAM|nr:hypothetical protein OE88DRAFT_1652989 [Heliocybe sulcata]